MRLLRRVLTAAALVLLVVSVPMVVAPRPIVEGLLDQPAPSDDVWIRLLGVAGVVLAAFHVLILRKLDDVWWWCWAFVIFDGASTVIVTVHAAVGVTAGAPAWPWWAYGLLSGLFTGLYLGGMARAGQEKPLV